MTWKLDRKWVNVQEQKSMYVYKVSSTKILNVCKCAGTCIFIFFPENYEIKYLIYLIYKISKCQSYSCSIYTSGVFHKAVLKAMNNFTNDLNMKSQMGCQNFFPDI